MAAEAIRLEGENLACVRGGREVFAGLGFSVTGGEALVVTCGVTPQSAAENAKLPFFIAHAPAHSFITDMPSEALMSQ